MSHQTLAASGRGRLVVRDVDLSAHVDQMTDFLKASLPKDTRVTRELAHDRPAIEADATQLTQLILNLGTNARDAIGDRGGTITLRTAVADAASHVTLEVVDDGAGIDEAARQHLFEPFFTTRPEGRGLGLSTVSAVAKAHDAIIDVLSTLGQGSTFRVAFPATTRRARASDVMSGPAPVTGAEQASEAIGLVLVADDESLVRTLTAAFVKRFGGTTLEAADGAEALRIVSERGADLDAAILDLTMPGPRGWTWSLRFGRCVPTCPCCS